MAITRSLPHTGQNQRVRSCPQQSGDDGAGAWTRYEPGGTQPHRIDNRCSRPCRRGRLSTATSTCVTRQAVTACDACDRPVPDLSTTCRARICRGSGTSAGVRYPQAVWLRQQLYRIVVRWVLASAMHLSTGDSKERTFRPRPAGLSTARRPSSIHRSRSAANSEGGRANPSRTPAPRSRPRSCRTSACLALPPSQASRNRPAVRATAICPQAPRRQFLVTKQRQIVQSSQQTCPQTGSRPNSPRASTARRQTAAVRHRYPPHGCRTPAHRSACSLGG